MKKLLLLSTVILFVFQTPSFSQIGIGLGSHGLNIKTNPDARTGLILRTGFGFSGTPMESFVRPEAAYVKRHHYSEKTILYAGLGASGEMRMNLHEIEIGYGLLIPVGLELFPMGTKKLSLSLETGLNFLDIGRDEAHFGNYGLLEITFYLNNRED